MAKMYYEKDCDLNNLPGAFAQAVFFAIERIAKQERPSRNRQRGLRAAFAQGVIFAIEAVGTRPIIANWEHRHCAVVEAAEC